ncbi:glycosyltransferase, partial [Vibrio anguillarum]|uniref:glycosyltransferase family 2 protein n=2 Tax=Vibrio anguillarum TaxID=55601 RepID=UPI00188B6058
MKILTIIIPCFNAQKYIKECILSLNDVNHSSIEVIFVDDGSTDNTVAHINELLEKSTLDFKIIQQENSGVSSARNKGLEVSRGEHVLFFDSDDIIISNGLLRVIEIISNKRKNIHIFEYFNFNKSHNRNLVSGKIILRDNRYFLEKYLNENIIKKVSVCSCVFNRKNLIKRKIRFNTNYTHGEDQLFLLEAIKNQSLIYHENFKLLGYRQHDLSVTKKFNINRLDTVIIFDELRNIYPEYSLALDYRINKELVGIGTLFYSTNSLKTSRNFYLNKIKSKIRIIPYKKELGLKYFIFTKFSYTYILL